MFGGNVAVSSGQVSLEDRKLFIGGLGWDTTEKQLNEYFSKYGEIESISVKTNPNTGRSRGFAFVVFTNTEAVDQILNGSDHIINGRKVDAKKAIARTGNYGYDSGYSGYGSYGGGYSGGGYGSGYGNGYEYSNGYGGGYGDQSYGDGQSRGRSQQQGRHHPY